MEAEAYSISLWANDMQNNKVVFIQRVNQSKVILDRVFQSPNSKYLALNLFSEESGNPFVYVIDLEKQHSYQINNAYVQYWNEEKLMIDAAQDGYRTLQPIEIQDLKPIE